MSTLDQVRTGFTRALGAVADGWHELVDRAGDALTHFRPSHEPSERESAEERVAHAGARWGVLAADVSTKEKVVEVALEVPGMEAEDFDLQVVDRNLIVHGEKKVARERDHGRYHIMERAYGSFDRVVRLPVPVDEAGARAKYRHGVLHVTLPRRKDRETRRIEVRSE